MPTDMLTTEDLLHETPDAIASEESLKGGATLTPDLLRRMNAYWRAANYVSVGQIYLYENPLLKEPLKLEHVKPLVISPWGTTPGQNFIYVHLNRIIKKYDLNMFYVAGPGHGGPAIVGNVYLEGTWSEVYPNVTQDEAGLQKLFKQFSFPGGISSHVAPTTPGSIHEGGELGSGAAQRRDRERPPPTVYQERYRRTRRTDSREWLYTTSRMTSMRARCNAFTIVRNSSRQAIESSVLVLYARCGAKKETGS